MTIISLQVRGISRSENTKMHEGSHTSDICFYLLCRGSLVTCSARLGACDHSIDVHHKPQLATGTDHNESGIMQLNISYFWGLQ